MAESVWQDYDNTTLGNSNISHDNDIYHKDGQNKETPTVFQEEGTNSQHLEQNATSHPFSSERSTRGDLEEIQNDNEIDSDEMKRHDYAWDYMNNTDIKSKHDAIKSVSPNIQKLTGECKIGLLENISRCGNTLYAQCMEQEFDDDDEVFASEKNGSSDYCEIHPCDAHDGDNESNAYQPILENAEENISNECMTQYKDDIDSRFSSWGIEYTDNSHNDNQTAPGDISENHQMHSDDDVLDENENLHSAPSCTNQGDTFDNIEASEITARVSLVEEDERHRIQSPYRHNDTQTTDAAFGTRLNDKGIQTAKDTSDIDNHKGTFDKGIQCDFTLVEMNGGLKQHNVVCSCCGNVNKVDEETQCKIENDVNNKVTNEIIFPDMADETKFKPTSVKSDTSLCNAYDNINRSGRHIIRNEWSLNCTKTKAKSKTLPKPASTDKRKRGRLRRFEKGDGSDRNGHCYQVAYDSAANIFFAEDGFSEFTSKRSDENIDSRDSGDVEDEHEIYNEEQFKTFNYLLNNCTPIFASSLFNFTSGISASRSDLDTTNSCDPNPSDGEDNGACGHKTTEKPYHSRFDNLSASSTAGSYLKEYLTVGNSCKYSGPSSYVAPDTSRNRTGLLLNTMNKRKLDGGGKTWMLDGSNNGLPGNRLAQMDEKGKVQASQFIGEYLYELWKNECLCDVSIKVGAQSYLAHKIVLAAFSDVFCPSEPMPTPTLMVDVPNSSPNAVFEILQYLYTSEMKITDDSLEDILNAALFLGVTDVVELIKDILAHPTKENVVHYLEVADRMQMPVNINDTPQLFREYLHEIWDSEIFKHITEEEMRKLLSDQMIMVDSETDLIIALSKWAEGDLDKRVKLVPKLLKYINFVRIEPDDLAKTTDNYPHIFNNTECQAILAEVYKSFAIIETSALKGDNMHGYNNEMPRTLPNEPWRKGEETTIVQQRPSIRGPPDPPVNVGKSHLTPDTDATRRSINNQFRRASRRMSGGALNASDDSQNTPDTSAHHDQRLSRKIQFDEADNLPHDYSSKLIDRKETAMPPKDLRKDQVPATLHRRSFEHAFQADTGAHNDKDYFATLDLVAGYDTSHPKPGGGGGYLNKDRAPLEKKNAFRDATSNKDTHRSSNAQLHTTPKRESMGLRDMELGGVKDLPLTKYKNELNTDKMKTGYHDHATGFKDTTNGYKDHGTGQQPYKRESLRDKETSLGTDCMNLHSEYNCPPAYTKCPSSRVSSCGTADCPPYNPISCCQPCPCSTETSSSSKAGVAPIRTRTSMRDQGRTSIRDTARASRRSSTRSPMGPTSRSPPNRRSNTPPPRKSETPPVHRGETTQSGVRRSAQSPNRDIQRTPQRRSMRLSMRDHQVMPTGSPTKPMMLEPSFSPTVITESTRPSLTRKVMQTYKQENPETFNHISTPTSFKHEPSPGTQRKSREDMPLVFNSNR